MRLVKFVAAAAALALSGAAVAGGYVVNLEPGSGGKVRGYAGLHAVDDKNETALVRIVSPGLEIRQRGTIRVLVMNLGEEPFDFGPANVTLRLADGSELAKIPLDDFERGYSLVKREQNRAAAVEMQTRNSLPAVAGPAGSAMTTSSPSDGAGAAFSSRSDESALPGGRLVDAMYEVLMPETVEPQTAAGGYLVFELPKELKRAKADIPLEVVVRAGGGEHRFTGVLKWRR